MFSSPDLGSSVEGMGARFVFRPGSGTPGAIALYGVARHQEGPSTDNRVVVDSPCGDRSTGTSPSRGLTTHHWSVVSADSLPQPLREDGQTVYEARLTIDGAQVTVDLPGTHRILTDPRFSEWQGSFATFELYSNHGATDSIGAFEEIWASGNRD